MPSSYISADVLLLCPYSFGIDLQSNKPWRRFPSGLLKTDLRFLFPFRLARWQRTRITRAAIARLENRHYSPLGLDNYFERVLGTGNKLKSQARLRKPQPVCNHLFHTYFAGVY